MTHTKNNLPLYEERRFLNEEQQTIQKILNDFKQPIPSNYIKLKVEEGNYMGSTNPKWKDKPNHERYGFYLEEKEEEWVQIDIPHNLVEKLELEKGDDITYPLYLTIDISQKKLIRGAYTIENEEEVFINKPVSEKNAEAELIKRLKELEILREQVKELEDLKHEKSKLEKKSRNLEETIREKDEEIGEKERQVNNQKNLVKEETKIKEKLQKELKEIKDKKQGWSGFYEWLNANLVETINNKRVLRENQKNKYPKTFERNDGETSIENLILSLEAKLSLPTRTKVKYPAPNYVESKSFYELFKNDYGGDVKQTKLGNIIHGYGSEYLAEYEQIFADWKKDTLQNIK